MASLEHLEPLARLRPRHPRDMLVQVLAGPQTEREPVGEQGGGRGRRLSDDRRVEAHRRARTAVMIGISSVFTASPPRTPHTNELWPCREVQGWK